MLGDKEISTFDVTMTDFKIVKRFEASDNLNEVMPNLGFFELLSVFLFSIDKLKHITTVCILHHDTKTISSILEKGFFVPNYIWVIDTS